MKRPITRAPNDFKKAGKELWKWLDDMADNVDECGPAVLELCRIADRLAEVRSRIATDGLIDEKGRRNPLTDLEIKLSGQFGKLWRILGLADKADAAKRPVGRPPESERVRKWPA
jgi:hypothetical protein